MEAIREKLRELTKKEFIFITKSGDHSIKYALRLAKNLNKKTLLQDQGGWITYKQFCQKLKLEYKELTTDFGLIEPKSIEKFPEFLLLINSMPGYHALQDMKAIETACKKSSVLLINDASGSIGTEQAQFGDIVLGSFGKNKPINLCHGGFLATDSKEFFDFFSQSFEEYQLEQNIFEKEAERLGKKLKHWDNMHKKIIKDLQDFRIIHPFHKGINVIVAFSSSEEKEKLIKYCVTNGFEYVLCPKYIRVFEDAVSIEVKRVQSF